MNGTQIVGVFMIRNEDLYLERAVRNVLDFCDRVLVADNYSTDRTWDLARALARESSKIECHRVRRPGDSHELVKGYAGSRTWVFGVDGDELYDPGGLARFRPELLAGRHDDSFIVFGNVLNCTALDVARGQARGYLAPPCRSMTKLYNFRLLRSWEGPCVERMMGGTPVFQPGHDAGQRRNLHEQVSWEAAAYRCLHLCFLRRSSRDARDGTRPNPVELNARGLLGRIGLGWLRRRDPAAPEDYKRDKYMRGPLVTVDVAPFFPAPGNGGARR